MKEIVFAGFGGQGVLTAGLLMSQMALFKGYKATWMPQYGSAMRGGTANCTVKFGEGRIYNPSLDQPDIVLAMNVSAFKQFIPLVKAGGTIVINSDMVDASLNTREDIKIIEVPSTLSPTCTRPFPQILENYSGGTIQLVINMW